MFMESIRAQKRTADEAHAHLQALYGKEGAADMMRIHLMKPPSKSAKSSALSFYPSCLQEKNQKSKRARNQARDFFVGQN